MLFNRELNIENIKASAFLFGPRMTGKTTLLRSLKVDAYFDLLDPALELMYRSKPSHFWEEIWFFRIQPGSNDGQHPRSSILDS